METTLIGAIKVKDGLFIGDEFAAQDLEFVVANKVTHIINCAARQVPNHWEPIGVRYISFSWLDHDSQVLLDSNDKNISAIYNFIEQALKEGESTLVHSVRGVSRSAAIVSAYLIKRYKWGLNKALEFLYSRRPDLDIKPNFVNQLAAFENRLVRQGEGPRSRNWNDNEKEIEDVEELILRNTFLNSQVGAAVEARPSGDGGPRDPRINWSGKAVDIQPNVKNPIENGYVILKSCIKGSTKEARAPLVSQAAEKPKRKGKKGENNPSSYNSQTLNNEDNLAPKGAKLSQVYAPEETKLTKREYFDMPNNQPIPKKVQITPAGKLTNNFGLKIKEKTADKSSSSKIKRPITAPSKRPQSPKSRARIANPGKDPLIPKVEIGPKISSYDVLKKPGKLK
ncbi:unnamed protein product [Blepharisma stoltei]|uniref:Uncharacterized protein n=1 Tax=Blepharisma stoltei TaxID=1481888 RepID=A0AAU9K7S0_9CILI|nr:unnamed protein product [Blepharisma stoltei]